MNRPSDSDWNRRRDQIIGLGEHSARKSYYPELQEHIRQLEDAKGSLAQANNQLQAVLDSATEVAIIATDRDGLITIFNKGAEKMLGYSAGEMVGRQTPGILHLEAEINDRADKLSKATGRTVKGFDTFVEAARSFGHDRHEWTYVRKDGETLLVNLTVTPIHNGNGVVNGYLGIAENITRQKLVEQELLQREQLFHLLFEKSGDANLLIDGNTFIDCNEATLRMLGCRDKQQIIASHPADISPRFQPDGQLSSDKANEMIRMAFEHGCHRFEWTHIRADGGELPVEVMLTAIPMNNTWLLHTAWRDLTERKRIEGERERLNQNLLHSQKIDSIGRLAGGIAHDFNNLLTPIIGYAEMVLAHQNLDEKSRKRLHGIIDAAIRAKKLTSQLLTFGRKQPLAMKVIDLNSVISDFTPIFERIIREDITISIRLAEASCCIFGDLSSIEQVLMNLAINAQDAMPEGGTLDIATSVESLDEHAASSIDMPSGRYVKLEVSDTGHGMDRNTVSKIFEPFFTTKEVGKGTGLGLATVFGIVKQHEGHITVYSEPGHGTSFSTYIPLQSGAAEQEAPLAEPAAPSTCRFATVLLVEDNPMVREMTRTLLSEQGHRVLVAENPEQARAIMQEDGDAVDLMLSDIIMPGMNGPTLYEHLCKTHTGLKVLFMSGYSDTVISHRHLSVNGRNYIQKPFSSTAVLAKIQELLR